MNVLTVLLQAPAGAAGGGSMMWIMLIAMFVIMYFFMIRPQNKKQKEIANFRKSLQVNQSVITAGGIPVSYTHLRAHETGRNLVCRLLLEKKKTHKPKIIKNKQHESSLLINKKKKKQ